MPHLLTVGQQHFVSELTPIVQENDGRFSLSAVITCRNHDLELLQNHIQALAAQVLANFEPLVDPRLMGVMMMGIPARYHVDIRGTQNQMLDFKAFFPEQLPAG